jgi:hypothetical protein
MCSVPLTGLAVSGSGPPISLVPSAGADANAAAIRL